jgi:NAD-dependent dihydropyrimidine dehydrogenase PreA subunit
MDEPQKLREKYQRVLQQVWRRPDNCPICDSTFWNIGDVVDAPIRHPPPDLALMGGRKVYVYAPVTCIYCGFTMFFHTGILDVRDSEEIKAVPPLHAPDDQR